MAEPKMIVKFFNPGPCWFSLYMIGGKPWALDVKALLNSSSPVFLPEKGPAIQGDEIRFLRDNESSERSCHR